MRPSARKGTLSDLGRHSAAKAVARKARWIATLFARVGSTEAPGLPALFPFLEEVIPASLMALPKAPSCSLGLRLVTGAAPVPFRAPPFVGAELPAPTPRLLARLPIGLLRFPLLPALSSAAYRCLPPSGRGDRHLWPACSIGHPRCWRQPRGDILLKVEVVRQSRCLVVSNLPARRERRLCDGWGRDRPGEGGVHATTARSRERGRGPEALCGRRGSDATWSTEGSFVQTLG
eukprot:scaffold12897_cov29-Tisochrysis_lutea.AAC.6